MSGADRLRELELLAALEGVLTPPDGTVLTWVGDDASVATPGGPIVTSVDQTVMGVHADPAIFDHATFGARAMLGAISDIAAMGAAPRDAYLALMLPPGTGSAEALELIEAADRAAVECGARIAGGDLTAGPVLSAAVTVIGVASGRTVERSGAQPGDLIGVTGSLGGSAAGLAVLRGTAGPVELGERHIRPKPRIREGALLAASGVHAMIDVSDGLATDAAHIGRASKALLRIGAETIPLDDGVAEVARLLGAEPVQFAATGGEDFELLFCAGAGERQGIERSLAPTPVTWIGDVVAGDPGCEIDGRRDLAGWEHSF